MKKTVKTIATVIVFTIIALFVYRCFMVSDHSYGKVPCPTDALKSAFADGESEILEPEVSAEISENGSFSAYNMYYNPESGEVQVAVRWNRSTYEKIGAAEGSDFDFIIKNETTGEESPCTIIDSKSRSLYSYRRLTANAVIGDNDRVTIEMKQDGDSQLLKHAEQDFKEYKIPRRLCSALTD